MKPRVSRKEAPSRREEIVRWLKTEGLITYDQIQQRFKVAPMTSRRDVAVLASEGRIIKTLRGAMPLAADGFLTEGPLQERLSTNLAAKRAIARVAFGMIAPGNTLHLDGGTTCIELAKVIARSRIQVTIVTNSVLVSTCFCGDSAVKVIQIGGTLNPFSGCTTGADAEASAAMFFMDMGFFTTLGYIPGEGTFESSADTFRVKRAYAERCADVLLLADYTKFGRRGLSRVLEDSKIKKIVTDRPIPSLKDPRLVSAH